MSASQMARQQAAFLSRLTLSVSHQSYFCPKFLVSVPSFENTVGHCNLLHVMLNAGDSNNHQPCLLILKILTSTGSVEHSRKCQHVNKLLVWRSLYVFTLVLSEKVCYDGTKHYG